AILVEIAECQRAGPDARGDLPGGLEGPVAIAQQHGHAAAGVSRVVGHGQIELAVPVEVRGDHLGRIGAHGDGRRRAEPAGAAVAAADREIAAVAVGRSEVDVEVAVDVPQGQGARALVDADGAARPRAAAKVRTAAYGTVQAETVDVNDRNRPGAIGRRVAE